MDYGRRESFTEPGDQLVIGPLSKMVAIPDPGHEGRVTQRRDRSPHVPSCRTSLRCFAETKVCCCSLRRIGP